MHIGFVTSGFPPYGSGGGIVSYVAEIARALRQHGHTVTIFSMLNEDAFHERYSFEEIPVITVPSSSPGRVTPHLAVIENAQRLAAAVARFQREENRLDLLEVPDIGAYGLFVDLSSVRMVARLHTGTMELAENRGTGWDPRIRLVHRLEKQALQRARLVTALTRYQAEKARNLYGLEASKIKIIPNFVKILPLSPATSESGSIGFFGTLELRKGAPVLCESFNALLASGHQVSMVMAGRDSVERIGLTKVSIKEHCQRVLSSPDRVRFTGLLPRDETLRVMQQSLFVVLPSKYEAFPMVLLEAMQLGKAVVSTSVCGIPDIVEDGKSGILVSPDNAAELAAAMRELIEKPELRRAMGEEGRKIVERKYSEAVVIPQLVAMYSDL